jgi:hypothetical protein
MPVEFLTTEQEERYGRFREAPTPEQLARYFWLDDQDHALAWKHRGDHNRLGFAIQLGTVRFLGAFLTDPTDVPENVVHYVAEQLDLDVKSLNQYRTSESRWDHTREIREVYGYHNFTDQSEHWRLVRWLYTHAWLSAERPSALFDHVTAQCIEKKILLPGVSVLARLVSQVRDRTSTRLWNKLSRMDRLRKAPVNAITPGIIKAISRLNEIRALGAEQWNVTRIPNGRLRSLARFAAAARAHSIKRMNPERRIATLVAFAKAYAISAQDDVLDLFHRFLTDLFSKTNRQEQKDRLHSLKDLDVAARQLREACSILLSDHVSHENMVKALFAKVSKKEILSAIQTVDQLTKPADQTLALSELFRYYPTIRTFLPKLTAAIPFEATPARTLHFGGMGVSKKT